MKRSKRASHQPDAADLMTRKDSEKDAERPHYYSQFWLDVAAGRRVIGVPKTSDENDLGEAEPAEPAPVRRTGRVQEEQMQANSDGQSENIANPVVEPVVESEDYAEAEPDEEPLRGEIEDQVEESDIPDMDLGQAAQEEEEEEEFYDEEEEEEGDEEEEEEDSDIGWSAGGRARKKTKPARPTRPPKKPIRRDTRRGGY